MVPEFDILRSKTVETLSREVEDGFRCWYAADGLPSKFVFWFEPGDPERHGDKPTDPPLKMFLVAGGAGDNLESYLTNELDLTKGVDFRRHANGERGGLRYFDIDSDDAVAKILARAAERGNGAAAGRARGQGTPLKGR